MKEKLIALLNRYFILNLSFLPAVFLLRLQEFLYLQFLHSVPAHTWKLELAGYLLDNFIFLTLSLAFLVPFMLLSLLNRRAGTIAAFIVFTGFFLVGFALVKYFSITLVPLDQVIFSYTSGEILQIVLSSTKFDPWALLAFILIAGTPLAVYHFLRKKILPRYSLFMLISFLAISPFAATNTLPDQAGFENDFGYFIVNNKVFYALSRITASRFGGSAAKSYAGIRSVAESFHEENKDFEYLDPDYPFLRVEDSKDVLGDWFNLGPDEPNLVFIVVESLSTSFSGEAPFYGSFMPFLDSLSRKSLYWGNFLSTSERTFNVFSAIFGSLPYSNAVFYTPGAKIPYHFSMIRYLREQGYHPYFFYAGDTRYSGYENFMKNENVEYILKSFPDVSKHDLIRQEWFEWGYPDGILFRRSMEIIDSLNQSPRLEIYLTLSMHEPFTPPDKDHYLDLLSKRIESLGLRDEHKKMVIKQRDIFASILYSDEALREFFNTYSKRPDFRNTIFFITGDHAMPELNTSFISQAERYHVPFIIYSPMLKSPAGFQSVSSHLDVTPSVLAMMKNRFGVKIRPFCHWLGQGIDFYTGFRNIHSLSLIFNNRMEAEYIRQGYFLSINRLFRLLPGLRLLPVDDTVMMHAIRKEQSQYLKLSSYVAERNALVPADLYFSGYYQESDFIPAVKVTYTLTHTSDEYIPIVKGQRIGEQFMMLKMDLSLTLRASDPDTAHFPDVVVQVLDSLNENKAWYSFRLEPSPAKGQGERYDLRENIDLSFVQDIDSKFLKIYLWNRRHEALILDNLQISLKGFTVPAQ